MTIPLQSGKSVRVSPSSCSQLLIRPSPRSGLGRALSIMVIMMWENMIHNDYDDGHCDKVKLPEGCCSRYGLRRIVIIKRFNQGLKALFAIQIFEEVSRLRWSQPSTLLCNISLRSIGQINNLYLPNVAVALIDSAVSLLDIQLMKNVVI